MNSNVIWRPQPKQAQFMQRREYEALYGGAAGGGKSDALVMEALRQVHIPHYKGLIMRKTFPQLAELIDKSLNYYKRAYPRAVYNDTKHTWTFPSGARIIFGSLNRPKDRYKYQGQAYDYIAFDELTHFTWDEYAYLFSRNRPNGPGTRVYLRATANPGGIGHGWVKERFVTASAPGKTIWSDISWTEPDGTVHHARQSRIFIQASVFDNAVLLRNDPAYVQRLASMPQAERAALLYGDWNSFTGQVFVEFRDVPERYAERRGTHVIAPFKIPDDFAIVRGFDWGYSRPFAVGWFAVDRNRRLYMINELYGCTSTPNTGLQWEPARVAREIKRIEAEDPNLKGRRIKGIGDPAIWASDGTESIGALMEREGVYFEPGDNSRISGKMQIHHRLAFDAQGEPMLYIFRNCRNTIRTLPALVYSERYVEDVDTDGEDHLYDALRYVCMANPIAPRAAEPEKEPEYDPLDVDYRNDYDRYDFFTRY